MSRPTVPNANVSAVQAIAVLAPASPGDAHRACMQRAATPAGARGRAAEARRLPALGRAVGADVRDRRPRVSELQRPHDAHRAREEASQHCALAQGHRGAHLGARAFAATRSTILEEHLPQAHRRVADHLVGFAARCTGLSAASKAPENRAVRNARALAAHASPSPVPPPKCSAVLSLMLIRPYRRGPPKSMNVTARGVGCWRGGRRCSAAAGRELGRGPLLGVSTPEH